MVELPLFDKKKRLSIDERFRRWTAENPNVVALYLKFARQAKASGREQWSTKALTERVRWEVNIGIDRCGDEFRVNNNYSAPMARMLVELDPSLEGMFTFRKRSSKP